MSVSTPTHCGISSPAPTIGAPKPMGWGFPFNVEIFCELNAPNSAIAMRDRAARTQGGAGVRRTRDFRPVFWTHRDPLLAAACAAGAHYGAPARCLRLARGSRRGMVTPVSTGRPIRVCAKLQPFAKNCNKINNLSHFCQFLAFLTILGSGEGEGLGQVACPSPLSAPVTDPSDQALLARPAVDSAAT